MTWFHGPQPIGYLLFLVVALFVLAAIQWWIEWKRVQ